MYIISYVIMKNNVNKVNGFIINYAIMVVLVIVLVVKKL
ncbi:putative membrane protein [Candidatus Neoehrlichia lotoris str. RAC413]|uniref:Putative membrane protein n=1 Tax=Candidatus Neoehrlichia procyonis str. RAC413 TaxID=1359163 RepID=A0A0F3NPI0_9RICK|nr:putative membrane protein [Candidatus Neoehrlichia lotoris str. RAC413]